MRRFRRTTLITAFCLAILAGLGLARVIDFSPPIYAVFLLPLLILLRGRRATSLILVLLVGLSLGLWRGGQYMAHARQLQSLAEQKITIQAISSSDSIYGKRSQIQFT